MYASTYFTYHCHVCNVMVCRVCKTRVQEYHIDRKNIFGCNFMIYSEMLRIFTFVWCLLYIALTPILSIIYALDFYHTFLHTYAIKPINDFEFMVGKGGDVIKRQA